MKKTAFAALAIALTMGMAACSDKTESTSESTATAADSIQKPEAVDPGEGFTPTTNIRYIDQARLMDEYNLGKDLQEIVVHNESDIQRYYNSKQAEIQKLASEMETKYRNGGYLSEQSLKIDQQKLQKLQEEAEAGMNQKQQLYRQQVEELTYNINTNVQKFLVEYNKEHHYDAILYMSAGAYFNPELDITTEVIEGLNKIYNKYHEPEQK